MSRTGGLKLLGTSIAILQIALSGCSPQFYRNLSSLANNPTNNPTLGLEIAINSSNGQYACAIRKGGTVWCWGDNSYGQLGNGSSGGTSVIPVQVVGVGGVGYLTGVSSITAGWHYMCAIISGGVYCWGDDSSGQLGNGYIGATLQLTPFKIPGFSGAVSLGAGMDYTCSVQSSGSAYCWGDDTYGQLGNNSTGGASATPSLVQAVGGGGSLNGITSIVAGYAYTCALVSSGNVYCWGSNGSQEIGNSATLANQPTPLVVNNTTGSGELSNIVSIGSGNSHVCAIDVSGSLFCWGDSSGGDLGDGLPNGNDTIVPKQVLGVGGVGYLSDIVSVTGGPWHTCAIDASGNTYCWGDDSSGEIGDNYVTPPPWPYTAGYHLSPTPVLGQSGTGSKLNSVSMAAGWYFNCAMDPTAAIYCWGNNANGQVGNSGAALVQPIPMQVLNLP